MLSLRSLLSAYILLATLAPCILGQKAIHDQGEKRDLETFQKLLDEADPPALHEALHALHPQKFKHGAFPEDRTAVEFIHKEEPSVATSIVNLARRQNNEVVDLSKRQDPNISNGTTTTTDTPPNPNPESSTRVTPVPPVSESSTPAPESTTEPSTSPVDEGPSTTTIPISTSNDPPVSSAVVSTTSAAEASTSAPPVTSGSPTTTRPSPSLTTGQVVTTTNAVGLTVISTVGGGATTISPSNRGITSTNTQAGAAPTSVVVQTSTLPNGSKSVVTAVTVVGAGENGAGDTPSGTAGVGPTSTSASPGLQTGEAVMTRGWKKEMVLIVGGAVAFAGMM